MKKSNFIFSLLLFLPLFLLLSCSSDPEPILYGEDVCANCKMGITDHRYGSEIVTEKGKIYKFDSVECLAAFVAKNGSSNSGFSHVLVTDYQNPNNFMVAKNAAYIHSSEFRSPMGLNLSAFSNVQNAKTILGGKSGEILDWPEVIQLVRESWLKK